MKINFQYFILITAILMSMQVFAGAGLTYHGRLLDPNGDPVIGSSVQFKVQLRTPGAENCLLYEEVQVKDLSQSSGVFSVTINDGSGTRLDSSGYAIDQIFANRGSFTFAGGQCAAGTTYNTSPTDGRKIQVLFNDGRYPAGQWEPAPPMAVNFVPIAIESLQVGGYKKESLIKIADGVPQAGTELNAASWAELLALIAGTTTQYVKPGSASFTAAPQWSGVPSTGNDLANKTYVDAQIAAGLPNIGTPGTYTKVTTDSKGRVSSGTTLSAADIPAHDASKITTGTLPIANGGTNSSAALTGSKVMVSSGAAIVEGMASSTTKTANTFAMRDGSGNIAGALGTFDSLSVLLGGNIALNGSVAGAVSLVAPSSVTSYTITLPAAVGSTGQVLSASNGTGSTSWVNFVGLPATAGTAPAPGYAFIGNTNTGLYNPAANQIGISNNGAETVRIDASGNVGVGVAAPAAKLEVAGDVKVGNSSATCSSTTKGSIRYNNGTNVLEFCNGSSWNLVQAAACTNPAPSMFTFTDQANTTASTLYTSNIVQITGINCTIPVTISGPGSPQIQICSDAACSTVVQGWTSSASSIVNNQYLQIRQTSDAAGGATVQATVIAGGTASIWSVANAGGDCVGSTPPVGTVCADGSIYAGLSPDGSVKMFTTRCDYGQTWNGSNCTGTRLAQNWNNGTSNWTDTYYNNANTGKANTAGLVALVDAGSPYQAANACKNLNDSGHTDWYVPALNELNVLYVGKNTIRNFDTSGPVYWSSTEFNNVYAWYERFSDGYQYNFVNKNNTYLVRCVRR